MKGASYRNSVDSVQGSFEIESHQNLAITSTASTSAPVGTTNIILSLLVGAHVKIGEGEATTASLVLPAGVWTILTDKKDTVSVLMLTGSDEGQASVIIPGE